MRKLKDERTVKKRLESQRDAKNIVKNIALGGRHKNGPEWRMTNEADENGVDDDGTAAGAISEVETLRRRLDEKARECDDLRGQIQTLTRERGQQGAPAPPVAILPKGRLLKRLDLKTTPGSAI